jgi:hypothetical protein
MFSNTKESRFVIAWYIGSYYNENTVTLPTICQSAGIHKADIN